jgi:hypothetical protein
MNGSSSTTTLGKQQLLLPPPFRMMWPPASIIAAASSGGRASEPIFNRMTRVNLCDFAKPKSTTTSSDPGLLQSNDSSASSKDDDEEERHHQDDSRERVVGDFLYFEQAGMTFAPDKIIFDKTIYSNHSRDTQKLLALHLQESCQEQQQQQQQHGQGGSSYYSYPPISVKEWANTTQQRDTLRLRLRCRSGQKCSFQFQVNWDCKAEHWYISRRNACGNFEHSCCHTSSMTNNYDSIPTTTILQKKIHVKASGITKKRKSTAAASAAATTVSKRRVNPAEEEHHDHHPLLSDLSSTTPAAHHYHVMKGMSRGLVGLSPSNDGAAAVASLMALSGKASSSVDASAVSTTAASAAAAVATTTAAAAAAVATAAAAAVGTLPPRLPLVLPAFSTWTTSRATTTHVQHDHDRERDNTGQDRRTFRIARTSLAFTDFMLAMPDDESRDKLASAGGILYRARLDQSGLIFEPFIKQEEEQQPHLQQQQQQHQLSASLEAAALVRGTAAASSSSSSSASSLSDGDDTARDTREPVQEEHETTTRIRRYKSGHSKKQDPVVANIPPPPPHHHHQAAKKGVVSMTMVSAGAETRATVDAAELLPQPKRTSTTISASSEEEFIIKPAA